VSTTTAISAVPANARIIVAEPHHIDSASHAVVERPREYLVQRVESLTEEQIRFARETSGYDYRGCVQVTVLDAAAADLYIARGRVLPSGKRLIWQADRQVQIVEQA